MRPIKYRVPMFSYDGKFSHFSYWGRIDHTGAIVFNGECFTSPEQSNKHTPGDDEQFIGLHDKNGKEIYEGDIVTGWFDHEKITGNIFYGSDAKFYIERNGLFGIELNNAQDWTEVIGNIYENPELLEGDHERTH